MKRFIFLCIVFFVSVSINAQKTPPFLICTGDNVLVRQGPGADYKTLPVYGSWYDETTQKFHLFKSGSRKMKNDKVQIISLGEEVNGFLKVVVYFYDGMDHYVGGWVTAKYFSVCPQCNGNGKRGDMSPGCSKCGGISGWKQQLINFAMW